MQVYASHAWIRRDAVVNTTMMRLCAYTYIGKEALIRNHGLVNRSIASLPFLKQCYKLLQAEFQPHLDMSARATSRLMIDHSPATCGGKRLHTAAASKRSSSS